MYRDNIPIMYALVGHPGDLELVPMLPFTCNFTQIMMAYADVSNSTLSARITIKHTSIDIVILCAYNGEQQYNRRCSFSEILRIYMTTQINAMIIYAVVHAGTMNGKYICVIPFLHEMTCIYQWLSPKVMRMVDGAYMRNERDAGSLESLYDDVCVGLAAPIIFVDGQYTDSPTISQPIPDVMYFCR